MQLEEAVKQLEGLINTMNKNKMINVTLFKEDKQAIETLLKGYKDSIPKKKIEEELKKSEKWIRPYTEHNKESRFYWMHIGIIRLCKKLLKDK